MDGEGSHGMSEEEIEAVETLMGFVETHNNTWYFKWGCRRKRSALDDASPLETQPAKKLAGASAVPEPEVRVSPDSPFEFAGVSGEKDKPRPSKPAKKIMRKKDCVEMIEELTKTKQVLVGEIENARKHRNELLVLNSELKAMKEQALNKKEDAQTGTNLGPEELSQNYHHRQPSILDPTAESLHSSITEMDSSNRPDPRGFDLNLLPEECLAATAYAADVEEPQPSTAMEDRRAISADARRRRKGMMKIKNMRSACGVKLPCDDK